MRFEIGRKYDAQLILARAKPWQPRVWKQLAAALDPVFGAPAKTVVVTNQKLGRHGWDAWQKWTRAKGCEYVEVWSPSRSHFARTGRPPDAFLEVMDPRLVGERHTDGIASYVLLAIAVDVDRRETPEFLRVLDPVQRFTARQPWGRPVGRDAFEATMQYVLFGLERNARTGKLRVPASWKPARSR